MSIQAKIALRVLLLSLLCCVFEGAVRKWGVGDSSITGRLAYLSKDILLIGFFALGAGCSGHMTNIARPFLQIGLGLLSVGALLSCVSGFEPIGAVLTMLTFFILPAAAWIGARVLPADALRRFALWIAILSLPLAFLGLLQFYSPSSNWINRYSTVGEYVVTSGINERVRATGTFSYISGLGEFASVAVWAGIVTFTLARSRRVRWLGYAALAAGMCCAFVTVSRAVTLISFALVAVWSVAGGQFGRKAQVALTIGAMMLIVLSLTGNWETADEVVSTVYLRHAASEEDTFSHRMWYQFIHPLAAIEMAPLGSGLGSQQVATSLDEDARRLKGAFESAWGKTILELGVLGFLGFLITWCVVFVPLKAAYQMNTQGAARTVLAVTGVALLERALLGFQFNHVAAYFFWAMSAVVLALGNGPEPTRLARQVRLANSRVARYPSRVQ